MKYCLRHNQSGMFVKVKAMFGSAPSQMEADKFNSPEEAIAAAPLPVKNYTVCLYKGSK